VRAKVVLALLPFVFSLCMALTYAQTLSEENRRLIERQEERLSNYAVLHQVEVDGIKARILAQNDVMQKRLDGIETSLWRLIMVVTGTAGVVGVDKAGYYVGRKKGTR